MGLDRRQREPYITISDHALARYRRRFDSTATQGQVVGLVRRAMRDCDYDFYRYLRYGGICYIVFRTGSRSYRVGTCYQDTQRCTAPGGLREEEGKNDGKANESPREAG